VQLSETFERWDVSGAQQCTVSLGNLTKREWPSECSFANTAPKLNPTSSIGNATFTNVFYNPECYAMNGSTKILIPLVNANEGVRLCVCVKPKYLPEKSTIYWAAALFALCNIGGSLCEFFATTYDADWAATIFSIYGAIQYMVENNLGIEKHEEEENELESTSEKLVDVHVANVFQKSEPISYDDKKRLPELRPMPRDDLMIWCGLLSVALIGLGNWLVALNNITVGLYVAVIGSLGVKNSILAYMNSAKEIDRTTLQVVDTILVWAKRESTLFDGEEVKYLNSKLCAVKADMNVAADIETTKRLDELTKKQDFKLKTVTDQLDEILGIKNAGEWTNGKMRRMHTMGGRQFQVLHIGHKGLNARLRSNAKFYKTVHMKNQLQTYAKFFEKFGILVSYFVLGGIAAYVCELQASSGKQGRCIEKSDLPSPYTVYVAAITVTVSKLAQSHLNWRAHIADKNGIMSKLTTAWTQVFSIFLEQNLYDKSSDHHMVSDIEIAQETDLARLYQGIGCILGMCLGYYFMVNNAETIIVGLFITVIFGFMLADAAQGYVDSENGVMFAQHRFISKIVDWAAEWLDIPVKDAYDGVDEQVIEHMRKYRKDCKKRLRDAIQKLDLAMESLSTAKSTYEISYSGSP
jgi:hypothetical protein